MSYLNVGSSLGRLGTGRGCVGFLYEEWIAVYTPHHKSCLSGWFEFRDQGIVWIGLLCECFEIPMRHLCLVH